MNHRILKPHCLPEHKIWQMHSMSCFASSSGKFPHHYNWIIVSNCQNSSAKWMEKWWIPRSVAYPHTSEVILIWIKRELIHCNGSQSGWVFVKAVMSSSTPRASIKRFSLAGYTLDNCQMRRFRLISTFFVTFNSISKCPRQKRY